MSTRAAATSATLDAGWVDNFNGSTLDPRWTWVREDPNHWSLADHPGYLRIKTQNGSLRFGDNTGRNVLVTWPNLDNFQIETKVTITPAEVAQHASLLIYQDDDNFVQIGRYYAVGGQIRLRVEIGAQMQSEFIVTEPASTVYLRLAKFNNFYIGSYSTDGSNWIQVAGVAVALSDAQVGITANNGPSLLEIPADFDYVQLSELASNIRYVAPNGNCGGATPCYATIQSAVDAASGLDWIKVAAGAYTDMHVRPRNDVTTTGVVTQMVYVSVTLTIEGGYTTTNWTTPDPVANPTTLNAQGKGRVIYTTGDIAPVIEGLRITGGDGTGFGGDPTCPDCDSGGGVYVWRALAALRNNQIFDNSCASGGGAYVAGPGWGFPDEPGATIEGNTIYSNTATYGAGLALAVSAASVIDNRIYSNTAGSSGGGIEIFLSSPTLQRNAIHSNNAGDGGGISFQWADTTLVNNVIVDNLISGGRGSGLRNDGSNLHMSHNTIARNTGGDGSGLYVVDLAFGQPIVVMTNTILVSQPVGISAKGVSTVTVNGILWHNTPITVSKSMTAVVTVNNQFTGSPFFTADGYHLSLNSAAKDKGVNSGVSDDIDGRPRPRGPGYDLGADEFWWEMIFLPLVRK
jgi:regulation of enolase protein 1 (concanavalin A-like superfamily)